MDQEQNVTLSEALSIVRRAIKRHFSTDEDLGNIRTLNKWFHIGDDLYTWRTKLQDWLKQ